MSENKDRSDEVIVLAPVRRPHPALLVAGGVFAGIALSFIICRFVKDAEKHDAMRRQLVKAP